jgi:hypothetical protein
MNNSNNKLGNYKWVALFGLWVFHGVIEFHRYYPLFVESLGSSFFELSVPHFLVFVFLIVWILINVFLLGFEVFSKIKYIKFKKNIINSLVKNDVFFIILSIFLLVGLFVWVIYTLFSAYPSAMYDNYFRIVMPIVNICVYVSLEIVVVLFVSRLSAKLRHQYPTRSFFVKFITVFLILSVLSSIIAFTGIGIVPSYSSGDWSRGLPAVPLLEWQIIIACIVVFLFRILELRNPSFLQNQYAEIWICGVVWLLAVGMWLSQPMIPNASALKPHEPNFEIYPFLDAQTYDQYAQSVLVGQGYGSGNIPQRPLYIAFLTFAHLLVGQEYESLVMLQTVFLAFFPVLLYLLGKEFFSRSVGLSVALLAIFRDYTSNLVSPFTGNLSFTKVLLAEIPVAIFLVLFLIFAIRWLRSGFSNWLGFLIGGVLGLAVLTRTQAVVALAAILFVSLFVIQRSTIGAFIKSGTFLLIGMLLVVTPWIVRNWAITGDFIFDNPESQTLNLALRYGRLNNIEADLIRHPEETAAEYNQRLSQMASDAFWADPLQSFWGITNTFLNHCINNILIFPIRYELKSPQELLVPVDAFWEEWVGNTNLTQSMLMTFYILLFGVGVVAAWQRYTMVGLLPLILNLLYNLWTSLALLSGQRFMVTMDWSMYLYYMIGFFALIGLYQALLNNGHIRVASWFGARGISKDVVQQHPGLGIYVLSGFLFLFLGSLSPLVEHVFPNKYPNLSNEQVVTNIIQRTSRTQNDFNMTCLQSLEEQDLLDFVQGRALYPRYYIAGDGERITDAVGYKVVDVPRLVFEFVGQSNARIVFPLTTSPEFFPHASDVTLVYGEGESPWFIYVEKESDARFYVSRDFDLSLCK